MDKDELLANDLYRKFSPSIYKEDFDGIATFVLSLIAKAELRATLEEHMKCCDHCDAAIEQSAPIGLCRRGQLLEDELADLTKQLEGKDG